MEFLRERGLAGATVLRGIEGFGANARLHTTRLLRLSEDLPLLIEVVDQEDRIRAVLPELDEMVGDGLITLERIEVVAYRGTGPGGPPAAIEREHRVNERPTRGYRDRPTLARWRPSLTQEAARRQPAPPG